MTEQERGRLRLNGLVDGKSITNAFIAQIKDALKEALKEKITARLGYSR